MTSSGDNLTHTLLIYKCFFCFLLCCWTCLNQHTFFKSHCTWSWCPVKKRLFLKCCTKNLVMHTVIKGILLTISAVYQDQKIRFISDACFHFSMLHVICPLCLFFFWFCCCCFWFYLQALKQISSLYTICRDSFYNSILVIFATWTT